MLLVSCFSASLSAACARAPSLGLRLRNQSVTQSGGEDCVKAAFPSACIHIKAKECLQGNLRLGQVHL
jgi:hypothetical protein